MDEEKLDYKDLVIIRAVLLKAANNLGDSIREPYRQNAINSFNLVRGKIEAAINLISEDDKKKCVEGLLKDADSEK
jgi:hypothetical protein